MDVRFLQDFRGRLTQERFYRAGEVADLPNGEALALVAQGVCAPLSQGSNVRAKPKPRRKAQKSDVRKSG